MWAVSTRVQHSATVGLLSVRTASICPGHGASGLHHPSTLLLREATDRREPRQDSPPPRSPRGTTQTHLAAAHFIRTTTASRGTTRRAGRPPLSPRPRRESPGESQLASARPSLPPPRGPRAPPPTAAPSPVAAPAAGGGWGFNPFPSPAAARSRSRSVLRSERGLASAPRGDSAETSPAAGLPLGAAPHLA